MARCRSRSRHSERRVPTTCMRSLYPAREGAEKDTLRALDETAMFTTSFGWRPSLRVVFGSRVGDHSNVLDTPSRG